MALVHFFQMLPVWLSQVIGMPETPMAYGWAWFLGQFVMILIFDVVLLVLIAYLLLADRKIWAAVQMRRGPNVVGPFGLFQTFADLFKFLCKEVSVAAGSNKVLFLIAPLITVILAFAGW